MVIWFLMIVASILIMFSSMIADIRVIILVILVILIVLVVNSTICIDAITTIGLKILKFSFSTLNYLSV